LNNLRYYSRFYFHGHSVGGTNPSLLEAMACGCMILAHDNNFNKAVLGDEAFYFSDSQELIRHLDNGPALLNKKTEFVQRNYRKVDQKYNWEKISSSYEAFFREVAGK
jgi:glycosyltransferase involved in cell wall biosynthesis